MNLNWLFYNELGSNWIELDSIFEVILRFINKTEMNWIECCESNIYLFMSHLSNPYSSSSLREKKTKETSRNNIQRK